MSIGDGVTPAQFTPEEKELQTLLARYAALAKELQALEQKVSTVRRRVVTVVDKAKAKKVLETIIHQPE